METRNVVQLPAAVPRRASGVDTPDRLPVLARLRGLPGRSSVRDGGRLGVCPVAGRLHHYVIPRAGRWFVVYRLPGIDGWEQPVSDCPSQAVAQGEADRLNGGAA